MKRSAVIAAVLLVTLVLGVTGARATATVTVYPTPGDRYEQPGSQITFRGISAGDIGTVKVVGSKTGVHTGTIKADSDGDGGSWIPSKPFAAGETVTVTTGLDVLGGKSGTFSFQIERPGPNLVPEVLPDATGPGSVQHFHSAPSLRPAVVHVTKDSESKTTGDIFVAPQFGPSQNGPMILDPWGNLVWFDPIPISDETIVTDFRTQTLGGQPVLTWFQGTTTAGTGEGEGVILGDHYQQIATVHAGNGLHMDLHEFLVTNSGDAYIVAVAPVKLPGVSRPVLNSVLQEIDIKTGMVLFQWDALDHLSPAADSYQWGNKQPGHNLDPFHANSISLAPGGNLVVSMRNTDAVYEINGQTGSVMWELGGRHSSFKMGSGTATAFQHDAVLQPNGHITIFDDGAGPPKVHGQSRGIEVAINQTKKTATLVRQVEHSPALSANFEGSTQYLPGGELFLGWGQQPYFTEFNAKGQIDFDAHFATATATYRAYRLPWSAQPTSAPALATGTGAGGTATLWESWNGDTDVTQWRVLAGPSAHSLVALGRYNKYKFESTLTPGTGEPDVAVQALNASGNVLASSPVQTVPNHVQIFGASAFVPSNGLTGVPVGCYSSEPCHLSATATSGRTVVAASGRQYYRAGSAGLLYFRLSRGARSSLARSRSHRLDVTVSVRDSSGARTASARVELVGFSTRGSGPKRTYASSPGLQIVGGTDFVSSSGLGGVLLGCRTASPCRVTTTISSGSTVISTTKPEYVNGDQLGYVHFSLTSTGRSLLSRAAGNQLPVTVSVSGTGGSASSQSALVAFR